MIRKYLLHLLISVSFCFLNGCKVGPNYIPPRVCLPESFKEDIPDKTENIEDKNLIAWWSIFNDPFLDQLLNRTLSQNYDYKIAFERIYQARAEYFVQFTQILPEFDASMTTSRFRTSRSFLSRNAGIAPTVDLNPIENFYQVGVSAIWEIDLWGKFRRATAASYDLWQASADDLQAVKIVIISDVANTYASILALQNKLSIAREVVELDEELLTLTKSRFDAGLANSYEVESSIALLESDASQLALAESALKTSIYSLSILLGELPENIINEFDVERTIPEAFGKIPVSIPSDLLRRRPDIRMAERQLAASTEEIGIAYADLFPSLSLTGSSGSFASNPLQGANTGFASDRLNKLFKPASLIWGVGGFVAMPIFDFGKRQAYVERQIAIRNQVYLEYQKTVMRAIQETEQSLVAYFNQEKSLESLRRQSTASHRSLVIISDLFQAGLTNYTDVLVARETWLQTLYAVADGERALMSDLIAVYKALGGNW